MFNLFSLRWGLHNRASCTTWFICVLSSFWPTFMCWRWCVCCEYTSTLIRHTIAKYIILGVTSKTLLLMFFMIFTYIIQLFHLLLCVLSTRTTQCYYSCLTFYPRLVIRCFSQRGLTIHLIIYRILKMSKISKSYRN